MTRCAALLAFLFAALLATASPAARFPESPDSYVADPAGLIPAADQEKIRATLDSFRRETGVQLTVLLIPDWRDWADPGQSVEDWTTALFNRWGVGASNRNDGILALVSPGGDPGQRVVRLELGAGYDASYSALAAEVVQQDFLPAFKAGDLVGGLTSGLQAVMDQIGRPHSLGLPAPKEPPKSWMDRLFPWVFGAVVAFIVGQMIFGRLVGDWAFRLTPCPQCGQRGMHREHVGPQEASADPNAAPLPGRIITSCPHCGYRSERVAMRGGDRSDSSGPGFGGGRSSGGGATGRW